jgi:hypothetical protein
MRVVDVLNDSPKVHGEGDVSFQLSDEVLVFIDERVRADCCTTLETGAGISTIVFAMNHSRHFCITPDAAQAERVTGYCLGHGITMDAVQFEIGRSEQVLPRLALPRLDLVLIDGRHGFPTPFIDWYYTAEALKSGGVLIIDDVQLWTGHELRSFLLAEREWQLERDFGGRASAFVKVSEGSHTKSWTEQAYIMRQTSTLRGDRPSRRRLDRARRLAELLRTKQFGTIARRLLRRRP